MISRPKGIPAGRIETGPPRKVVPSIARKIAGLAPPSDDLFVVRWTIFDFKGPWCLGLSLPAEIVGMMTRIRDMETMTPAEIFKPAERGLGVDYGAPENIPTQRTKDRLRALNLMDETCVSRLRITKKARLYGFRRDPRFYAVFWDPGHQIWP